MRFKFQKAQELLVVGRYYDAWELLRSQIDDADTHTQFLYGYVSSLIGIDERFARAMLLKAAEAKHSATCYVIACDEFEGATTPKYKRRVPHTTSLQLLLQSAKDGFPESQRKLGEFFVATSMSATYSLGCVDN